MLQMKILSLNLTLLSTVQFFLLFVHFFVENSIFLKVEISLKLKLKSILFEIGKKR